MMFSKDTLVADWVSPPWWLWPFARRVRWWYFGHGSSFRMWREVEWRWR